MGKFDKKVSKAEPDAPNSQKILKKKSNSQLAALSQNPKMEKERSLKILSWMQRAVEVKHNTKADAHLDDPDRAKAKAKTQSKDKKRPRRE